MAKNKTQPTDKSVKKFLQNVENKKKREDSFKLLEIMQDITGQEPVMWGTSMIGFDQYHYKYASGREGDMFMVGFSPRKRNLTIYIMPGYQDFSELLKDLGPHQLGKSCLYIKRLSDIHLPTLKKIIKKGYKTMKKRYE